MLIFVEFLLWLIRFMLGAALFSFMHVVAWRLPRGQSPLGGRSACPGCGAALTAADLVPVFSWLCLRGRCRHCSASIPVRYLLAELLGGGLAVGCTLRYGSASAFSEGFFGMSWQALLALALCGVLFAVAVIDAETQTIPDLLSLSAAVLGAINLALEIAAAPAMWGPTTVQHLLGAVSISGGMLVMSLLIAGAFGGGDIKLMAGAGLFLGAPLTLLAGFLALIGGGVYGIWLLTTKKAGRKDHFAFGPFLCTGIVVAMLAGEPILRWYFQFF